MKKKTRQRKNKNLLALFVIIIIAACGYFKVEDEIPIENNTENKKVTNSISYETSNIPDYNGEIYITLDDNIPNFTDEDFELEETYYSELVDGRVGMAMIKTNWEKANEDDKKDDYSEIEPSGFVQAKYDTNIIPGGYLYHRCHLIAWMLGGIDVDERNLMTGTRDFNVKGMKQFEDEVYNYLDENRTNNVLYRVTPYFKGDNSLASGVQIEAYSIEDGGAFQFNVYIYNVQDGIDIDYATGESKLAE